MRAPVLVLSLLLAGQGPTAAAQTPGSDLPDIGTPASTTLSASCPSPSSMTWVAEMPAPFAAARTW